MNFDEVTRLAVVLTFNSYLFARDAFVIVHRSHDSLNCTIAAIQINFRSSTEFTSSVAVGLG